MKIDFIIHSLKLLNKALALEKELGRPCYIPGRDTEQHEGGRDILSQNFEGMKGCVNVYVIWDGQSQGTLFDIGMAYALGISLLPVELVNNRSWVSFFESNCGGQI